VEAPIVRGDVWTPKDSALGRDRSRPIAVTPIEDASVLSLLSCSEWRR